MGDSQVTRSSLLLRIRDTQDREAWQQFVDLYAPLIYRFARRRGLQEADAADLAQDVLRAVSVAIHKLDYDPDRGSFRGWLFTVARNKLNDFGNQQRRQVQGTGDTGMADLLEKQPAPADEEAFWNEEYERQLFSFAAQQVRGEFEDSTWQAFWRVAVDGLTPKAVADALKISVGAVYIAKSRVLARLKKQIQQIQGE